MRRQIVAAPLSRTPKCSSTRNNGAPEVGPLGTRVRASPNMVWTFVGNAGHDQEGCGRWHLPAHVLASLCAYSPPRFTCYDMYLCRDGCVCLCVSACVCVCEYTDDNLCFFWKMCDSENAASWDAAEDHACKLQSRQCTVIPVGGSIGSPCTSGAERGTSVKADVHSARTCARTFARHTYLHVDKNIEHYKGS